MAFSQVRHELFVDMQTVASREFLPLLGGSLSPFHVPKPHLLEQPLEARRGDDFVQQ